MKIYFENPNTNSLKEFISSFRFDNDRRLFKRTFNDEKFESIQCEVAYRSLDDLFKVFKTYFEDITLNEVIKALFEHKDIKVLNCDELEVPVFYFANHSYDNKEKYYQYWESRDYKGYNGKFLSFSEMEKIANFPLNFS